MLSAVDEVINVLLLSLEATFSCLFCFHPGYPLCARGKLSQRKQKLIVSSLSASTSLYSYPFVWPVFRFLWDIAAEQKTPVSGFRWCTVFTPPETFSLFPTHSGVFASSEKKTCLVASALPHYLICLGFGVRGHVSLWSSFSICCDLQKNQLPSIDFYIVWIVVLRYYTDTHIRTRLHTQIL